MLPHEGVIRMRHMPDVAREAVALVGDKSRGDLDSERLLGLALVGRFEVLGEAASRVSEETRSSCPTIPWSQMVGFRNSPTHGYDSVDAHQ